MNTVKSGLMGLKLLENFGVLIVTISIKILDILKRPQKFETIFQFDANKQQVCNAKKKWQIVSNFCGLLRISFGNLRLNLQNF